MIVDPELGDEVGITDWDKYNKDWALKKCHSKLYLDGYLDFSPWRSNCEPRSSPNPSEPPRDCLRNAVTYYWCHGATAKELSAALNDPKSSLLFGNLIAASHWMIVLEYLSGIVSELEANLWHFEEMAPWPSASDLKVEISRLRRILADVNRWRRRSWRLLDDMNWNLDALRTSARKTTSSASTEGEDEDGDIWSDFESIHQRLDDCRKRIESLLPVVIGIFSLLEAQRSTFETKYATWLGILAMLFVPLTFTSGLFSMSDGYVPGEKHFWIYWAVALPLIAFVFLVMFAVKYSRAL
jgi:Mg2+ and Co2+ transporter CorA